VIIDAHTHVFPPEIAVGRERFIQVDPTFAELYADPKAKLASADDLLTSMTSAGVDVSVALGFAWLGPATVRLHNDYLLEAAATSGRKILPFCTLPLASGDAAIEVEMRRCLELGARGFGELRPDNLGFDLAGEPGRRLGALARELNVPLLFHASEPVGHTYPGKRGGGIESIYAFLIANPATRVILAHLGGGLPFFAQMPEVRDALAGVRVDTAACNYLYEPAALGLTLELLGPEQVVFGSDWPLISQNRARSYVSGAVGVEPLAGVMGDNVASYLGIG